MKTYKFYIQFILLVGLSLMFNQQAFSKIAAHSKSSNELIFESPQKKNLQKRLREQRKKLKKLRQQQRTQKHQGKKINTKKLLWTFILVIVMAFAVLLIRIGFSAIGAIGGASIWLSIIGLVLLILCVLILLMMYPGIVDFFF